MCSAYKFDRYDNPLATQPVRKALRKYIVMGCLGIVILNGSVVAAERVFYIQAIEHKGKANISSEPFPSKPLVNAAGMKVKAPKSDGSWAVESYGFSPAQITVVQGDLVTLHFIGINGALHNITIEDVESFQVRRGTTTEVQFTADKAGLIRMTCSDHQPTMTGQIVVLPK